MRLIFVAACLRRKIFNGKFFPNYGNMVWPIYVYTACTPYKALKAGTTTWMDTKKIFEIHDIYGREHKKVNVP